MPRAGSDATDRTGSDPRGRALERLDAVASTRGFPRDPRVLGRLVSWLEAILDIGRNVNLTAAKDLDQAVDVLALSSLVLPAAVERAPRLVVDLGTGNGLPGVAAALMWPEARVLLVERRAKKAAAVAEAARRVGLTNVDVIACDGRELLREREDVAGRVDLVTVRAVGSLADAAAIAAPWLAPGGRIAHWKGRALPDHEVRAGRAAARRLGLVEVSLRAFDEPAGPGRLVLYERPAGA